MTTELLSPEARSERLMSLTGMNGAGGREAERAVGERSAAAAGRASRARVPDPELVERPRRRRFSAEYKLRVLAEAEAFLEQGGLRARTARHWTLHLPARWPWQRHFIEALTRIRALPAAA